MVLDIHTYMNACNTKDLSLCAHISVVIIEAIERTTKENFYKSPFSLISPLISRALYLYVRSVIHFKNGEFVI